MSLDDYTVDLDVWRANAAAAAERFSKLPEEIQALAKRVNAIAARYGPNAGWYDRAHGDNIRLGQFNARIYRATVAAGLRYDLVLWTFAEYFTYHGRSG